MAEGSAVSPFSDSALRCRACGAPYAGAPQGEILTCTYCGVAQRTVDARQFLDHFMAQVTAFMRQAIPPGLDVTRSETIDPVARLAAFTTNIRPRLVTESEGYRFSCFNLLASPLAVFPFTAGAGPPAGTDPAAVSVFAAKVQSVSGLAVDDSSRELLRRSGGLASCYQSLLVATRLASGALPERFHLISQDLANASAAIASTGRWAPLSLRLAGLAQQSQAVDAFLTGRELGQARRLLGEAGTALNQARSALGNIPELGYMAPAVEQELMVVRAVGSMLDIAEGSGGVLPTPLIYVQRLSGVLDWLAQYTPGSWAPSFRSLALREELFRRAAELRSAQAGNGSVPVVLGGGGTYIPFWVVELPYTFETGVLWNKRGKTVPETLLVAATFPTDVPCLTGPGAGRVLTDIFSATLRGRPPNGPFDRLRGTQQKISESGGVIPVLRNSARSPLSGQLAVPPFTTEAEALRLVRAYIDGVGSANPKAASQLRASSPRVLGQVYLPCSIQATPPVPWLGDLSPSSLGDPQALRAFLA
jgi:hypothetical protein